MLVLWILLGVFMLIALLLALPLRIYLQYSAEGELQYRVKYCFLTLADSSKPEQPKKKPVAEKKSKKETTSKKKSGQSGASFLLSFLGLDEISTAAKAKQSISKNGLLETIGSVFAAVKKLFSRIFRLVNKGIFRKFDLTVTVGDNDAADAAMHYGALCAAIYPLLTLLDSTMKFRSRNVDIRCDYSQEHITAAFDGQLYYRPYHILGFAFGLIWQYLKQTLKKEGSNA